MWRSALDTLGDATVHAGMLDAATQFAYIADMVKNTIDDKKVGKDVQEALQVVHTSCDWDRSPCVL